MGHRSVLSKYESLASHNDLSINVFPVFQVTLQWMTIIWELFLAELSSLQVCCCSYSLKICAPIG